MAVPECCGGGGAVPECCGGGAVPWAGDQCEYVSGLHVQLLLALPLCVRYALLAALGCPRSV